MRLLRKNAESIEDIDSRIDVASVLAEMSYLIDEKIILKKMECVAENIVRKQETATTPGARAVVRAVRASSNNKKEPLGNVRFKIVIAGIAADASDVAILMCKLEDSPYFCQIVLSYSRGDAEMGIERTSSTRTETNVVEGIADNSPLIREAGIRENIHVNEFEINCYLANYREL
jgi:hypothetical protein